MNSDSSDPDSALRTPHSVLRPVFWDGRSGPFFEAWHIGANQSGAWAAFRIDYSVEAGKRGEAKGRVAFTSTARDRAAANVAAVLAYPMEHLRLPPAPGVIEIGPCSLETGRIKGMLDAAGAPVTWDLVYEPVTDPLLYFPQSFYRSRSSVPFRMFSPHPFLSIGGKIQIRDHQFILNGDSGMQRHTWGRRPPQEWTWFHCSSFLDERGEPIPAYVGGLIARQPLAGNILLPARSYGHLVWKEHHVSLQPLGAWEDRWSGSWKWQGVMDEESIAVSVVWRWDDMVASENQELASVAAYCHHCEVADCLVAFRAPRRPPRAFSSPGKAHVEIGARNLDPRAARRAVLQDAI